jgi:hypothetical protein
VTGSINDIQHCVAAEGRGERLALADPPVIAAALVVAPVARLHHSTFSERVVAERFTAKLPPVAAYTRYSAPVAALSARQKPVEDKLPCSWRISRRAD